MFDGVHRGHQYLLGVLKERAEKLGLRCVVVTFDRHPRAAVAGSLPGSLLTPLPEKRALLESLEMDVCALIEVESGILSMDSRQFVQQYLVEKLAARVLVVGYDFRFGKGRSGDCSLLRSMGEDHGFHVVEAEPVLVDGCPVKSTRIRKLLLEGDTRSGAELLGRDYTVTGRVASGDRIGRTIGFPTANVAYPQDKLLPAAGVYCGICAVGGVEWPAAINFGRRPTVSAADAPPLLEAHLPGFSGDIYDETICLAFGPRLRGEVRFNGLDALREQIQRDVEMTERWYAERLRA